MTFPNFCRLEKQKMAVFCIPLENPIVKIFQPCRCTFIRRDRTCSLQPALPVTFSCAPNKKINTIRLPTVLIRAWTWNVFTTLLSCSILEQNNEVNSIDVSCKGKVLVSGGKDAVLRAYDLNTAKVGATRKIKIHRRCSSMC